MTLAPLVEAGPIVQAHVATVCVAILMTLIILPLRKGTRIHRIAGWIWALSMMATAAVSFGINSFDFPWGVGPIHIFSVITMVNVPLAIHAIRRGRVEAHRKAMLGVAFGGLGVTGLVAFFPGRTMWEVLVG